MVMHYHRDGSAVLKLDDSTFNAKAEALGVNSALMIVSDYYGELVVTGDLTPRRACWFLSVFSFLYIVYELSVGLSAATEQEPDKVVKEAIKSAQLVTVISWCTYPVVYLFPMLGISASKCVWASRWATVSQTSFRSAVPQRKSFEMQQTFSTSQSEPQLP